MSVTYKGCAAQDDSSFGYYKEYDSVLKPIYASKRRIVAEDDAADQTCYPTINNYWNYQQQWRT